VRPAQRLPRRLAAAQGAEADERLEQKAQKLGLPSSDSCW
jgi:hypothetical protein